MYYYNFSFFQFNFSGGFMRIKNNGIIVSLCFICIIISIISCGNDNKLSNRSRRGALLSSEIINDEYALNQYLTLRNEEILVNSIPQSLNPSPPEYSKSYAPIFASSRIDGVTLTLVADIAAPVYNGRALQATNIAGNSNYVFVSYNMAGDSFIGAVQDIQLTNARNPRLISQVIYHNSDISAITTNGSREVILAMATDIDANNQFSQPALMGAIGLSSQFSFSDNKIFKQMPGYSAVSAEVFDDRIFIVSGDNSGLTVFNSDTYDSLAFIPIRDARDIAFYNNFIYVYAGTSGILYKINSANYQIIDTCALNGSTKSQEKSSIVISGKFAFIAANDSGVQIFNLESNTIEAAISNPVSAGLNADSVVANSVTVSGSYIFIANGEAGIRVFKNTNGTINSTDSIAIEEKGYLVLGLSQSANEIYRYRDYLVVASGIGGLKIIQISGL